MKAFCRRHFTCSPNLGIVSDWVENNVGIRENAGCHHFLLFLQCFQKAFFLGMLEMVNCVVKTSRFYNNKKKPNLHVNLDHTI